MQQAAHEPGKGYEEMAFAWAERARARSLLDSLGQRGWGPSIDLPPAMRRQAALNRHAIEEQEAALEKPHANTLQIAAKLHNLYHEQAALEAEQRAYVQGHGFAAGRVAELKAKKVVSVSEVQQKLLDACEWCRGDTTTRCRDAKRNTMSANSLETLLMALAAEPDDAAKAYRIVHARLMHFFSLKNMADPGAMADEVMDSACRQPGHARR